MSGLGLALAGVGSAAGGYVTGAREKQDADIKLADAQWEADQRQRQKDLQQSLQQAARPAIVDVGAGGMTKPAIADNIDVGQPGEPGADTGGLVQGATVNGQQTADPAAAAAAYNDPNAITLRQAQAYQAAGKPADAMSLQTNALALQKQQVETARTLKDEGAMDAAKALRQGDAQGMADAFNKSGKFKIIGTPEITPEKRDIPGVGEVTTYNANVTIQNPDGTTATKTINSHDLSMSLMPYEKALDLGIKGTTAEGLSAYRDSLSKARQDTADASKQRSQAYADREEFQKTGNISREKRLQYTDLFNKASQNMKVTQDSINRLQSDRMFMRAAAADPSSSQAAQLRGLQNDLAQHKQDYQLYQGFLAGSGGGAPAPAPAPRPATPAAASPQSGTQVTSQAQYDALPKGAKYFRPNDPTPYVKN